MGSGRLSFIAKPGSVHDTDGVRDAEKPSRGSDVNCFHSSIRGLTEFSWRWTDVRFSRPSPTTT